MPVLCWRRVEKCLSFGRFGRGRKVGKTLRFFSWPLLIRIERLISEFADPCPTFFANLLPLIKFLPGYELCHLRM